MHWRRRRYRIDILDHLAECDANYVRLYQLLMDDASGKFEEIAVHLNSKDDEIIFAVAESGKYTSTVLITRSMPASLPDLFLKVRVYHDAQCAEVVNYQGQERHAPTYDYPNPKMRAPDEKVQINRFLGELLSICLTKGRVVANPLNNTGVLFIN